MDTKQLAHNVFNDISWYVYGVNVMNNNNLEDFLKKKIDEIRNEIIKEQKEINKKKLTEIYNLYSQLEDDLYDGYLDSGWNGGVVTVDGKDESMGEMLDKLGSMFNEAIKE